MTWLTTTPLLALPVLSENSTLTLETESQEPEVKVPAARPNCTLRSNDKPSDSMADDERSRGKKRTNQWE